MAEAAPQNYENHGRYVPAFHFFAFGVLAINFLWSIYRLIRSFGAGGGAIVEATLAVLMAATFLVLFLYMRVFALTVQDRVIRLEERQRLKRLLPQEMRHRIVELTLDQLIALRFASDEELPALAMKVLDEKIGDRGTIKRMIKSWRADDLRV